MCEEIMSAKLYKLVFAICCMTALNNVVKSQKTLEEMKTILDAYNSAAELLCNKQANANWNVATDQKNDAKKEEQTEITLEYAQFRKQQYDAYFKDAKIDDYAADADVQRKLKFLKDIGTSVLSDFDLTDLSTTKNAMSFVYNTAKICPFDKQNCNLATEGLSLDPEIETLLAESTDFDELHWIWEQWHEKTGKLMRDDYGKYVELMNKAAVANGNDDAGVMWRSRYEYVDDKLSDKVDELWDQVKPLYDELHKYVHRELKKVYGDKMNLENGNIPAHLTGNMWAQSWIHLYDRIKPFKDASLVDVTKSMVDQSYNAKKMFEMSDEFYMSMGLPSSNMSYLPPSIIEKPNDVEIQCHASAWDFCDGKDFRIKMCTKVNMEDFVTVHHEMGHIMYYLLYKDQPLIYRTGANPGFHEAVGDTIALSVSTPQHLKTVGLLENYDDTEADNINSLFYMALERVAFLPFGLLIDKWRWEVFSGQVAKENWNKRWWELREQYQKVAPMTARNETFFDPGAKFHVPGDSQYIAYFVAHILEFSFYKSLCIEANQYNPANPAEKPLHKCDFYNSKPAGAKLKAGLELGYSKHWSTALKELTGEEDINAAAILEYFKPLYDFLVKQNKMNYDLDAYNEEAAVEMNKLVKAQWDVGNDSGNEEKQRALSEAVAKNAEFNRRKYEEMFKDAKPEDYSDEMTKRQLKFLTKLGSGRLSDAELKDLTDTQIAMEDVYNTAKICPFNKQDCDVSKDGLTLEPEITEVMSTSENFNELKWTWEQWHDKSGKSMRDGYKKYVELTNKAAKADGFADNGDSWRSAYEDDKFIENVDAMWKQVEPLYNELHTFVKRKLEKIYGNDMNKDSETIPSHLLGNMWAQSWVNLYERVKPYSEGSAIDINDKLKEKYTVLQMFEESNRFFKDLGLEPNDMSYDEKLGAVIHKPTNRTIACHASAWDFYDQEDFRIKMCTTIDQEDFVTVHHEMGHIQYFILYKHLPVALREGANPGFHEAVGDLIALSVATPTHLKKIGLLDNYADSKEDNINALFKMALERVAFMPFGLVIDKWRWDVFSGKVTQDKWNEHWWELIAKYQKVSPPSARNESFFDPGAKYHVPADVPYIRYFISHMLEFQMHRGLCTEIGEYDPKNPEKKPLHKCDIDGSKAAGSKIRAGLELGKSKHWSEALKAMTGEDKVDGSAVVEYFQPLYEYLKEANGVSHLLPGFKMIFLAFAASIIAAFRHF